MPYSEHRGRAELRSNRHQALRPPSQALAADLAVYAFAYLGDNLLVRFLDLFAGKRAVIGAIRKRKGHGLFARSDADGIAVDIEQAHALEQLAAGTRNTTLKILAGHSVVDHDSKVVLNGRVLRELTVVLLVAGALDQLVQVKLKGNDNLVDAAGSRASGWISPTQPSTVPPDRTSAAQPGCKKA